MQQIGDYELIERIGAGGMGEVWRAENLHTKLRYAVKLLPREATGDRDFVARFFDEGRVMAELDHRHIVRVHHVGHDKDAGRYYLVMDYVQGPQGQPQSLHEALEQARESRLPERQVHKWALQVAQGLAYAHGRGVVHRDIKPANVLIDKDGNARITDFGLAKAVGHEFVMSQIHQSVQPSPQQTLSDMPTLRPPQRPAGNVEMSLGDQETISADDSEGSHRTTAESLLGTYDYMSPEQRGELTGVQVGPASDIYAFGVMLYRVLTGRRPTGRARPASQVVPGLSKSWDQVTDRCLEHQPSDRYANGTELLAALQRVGRGKEGVARLVKAAICLIILAAVAVAGRFGWVSYRDYQDRQTETSRQEAASRRQRAEAATLLQQANQQYAAGEYTQALVTLGRVVALAPTDPNVVVLRRQIETAMRAVRPAQDGTEEAKTAFHIDVEPPEAMVTLTHDRLGLVVEEKVAAAGLRLDLQPGTYHALVMAEGYRTVQQDIEVSEGAPQWQVKLSERRGELVVVSNPGVSISATGPDGAHMPLGATDAQGRLTVTTLPEGDYTLTLGLADYHGETVPVSLVEGRPVEARELLTPLPGRLKIGGRLEMEVYEGGRRLGKANDWIDLSAGEHELELRCKGFRTEQMKVTIPPNRPVLRQGPALVAESGSVRISASSTVQGDDYLARQRGQIQIDGGPWREISLPHVEEGLSCESHQVELKLAGYGQASSKAVTIRDGEVSAAEFRLVPEDGAVRIASNASGAAVFDASGKRLGAVGAKLRLPPFVSHELAVKADRHKPAAVTVRIDRPGMDAGTRQVALEEQRIPADLMEVANAQFASLDGLASGSREAQDRQRRTVEELGLPLEVKTVRTGIVFRLIPAGTFVMGSPLAEQDMGVKAGLDREYVEGEMEHEVTLTKPFYCGKYEVTQGQWEQVTGSNPSYFRNAGWDAPVEQVSWEDCQVFVTKLCQMEGVREGTYRLLTESEWEYACRAGTSTALYNGDLMITGQNNGPALDAIAWYGGNSGVQYAGGIDSSTWPERQYNHTSAGTHPVGQKASNAWGLYDMIGNVREWCKDWYGPYADESATDPLGPALGVGRVSRGGSWYIDAGSCRSATRAGLTRDYDDDYLGLRLARTITVQSIQPVSRKSMARVRAIGLDGHITAVDMKNKLAEISIGAAVGVKQAMELHVTRGDEYVAQITIVDVLPDKAIGIVEGVQPGMQPRAGDRITEDLR